MLTYYSSSSSSSSSSSEASASHLMNGSAAFRTFFEISFATYYIQIFSISTHECRRSGNADLLGSVGTPMSNDFLLENVRLIKCHEDFRNVRLDEIGVIDSN